MTSFPPEIATSTSSVAFLALKRFLRGTFKQLGIGLVSFVMVLNLGAHASAPLAIQSPSLSPVFHHTSQPIGSNQATVLRGRINTISASLTQHHLTQARFANQVTCEFFAEPQRFNTQTNGDTIVIGTQPNRRYRVVLSGSNEMALAEIRACIPDAFATRSRIGPYIQVGSFETRRDAEIIQRILRKAGYRVRVNYAR